METNRHFVPNNPQLKKLQPPDDDIVQKEITGWTVDQLRKWLGLRGVRCNGALKEDLVRIVFHTWKLNLPLNEDEVTTQKEAAARLEDLLIRDDEVLPNPTTLTVWTEDLKILPTVRYADIYTYLIHTVGVSKEQLRAIKSLEAYNYTYNKFVQTLYTHQASADMVFIKAKVRPSQDSSEYEAWVMVWSDGAIEAGRCHCTAGLGEVCSHIAALLFKTMEAAELGWNEKDSCTALACVWNNNFHKNVPPELIDKMDFRKPRVGNIWKKRRPKRARSRSSSSSSSCSEMRDILLDACPDSVALHLQEPLECSLPVPVPDEIAFEVSVVQEEYTDLPNDIQSIVDVGIVHGTDTAQLFEQIRSSVTAEQSELVLDRTALQGTSKLWQNVRRSRITASNMGTVYTFMTSPRSTSCTSILNQIVSAPQGRGPQIRWGNDYEAAAIRQFTMHSRCKDLQVIRCGLKIPIGDAHIGATPDSILKCSCCPGDRLLEVKCPFRAACDGLTPNEGARVGCIPGLDNRGLLKENHKYFTQIQAQMAIFDLNRCEFYVWTPRGSSWESIPRDREYWNKVKPQLDLFYMERIIPKLMGSSDAPIPRRFPVPPPKKTRKQKK